MAAALATGAGLSLLIWAKLKIVASVPRSAYADPQAQKTTANGQAGEPGADQAPTPHGKPVVKERSAREQAKPTAPPAQ